MGADRSMPDMAEAMFAHGVPLLLDQLVEMLRHPPPNRSDEAKASAMRHGKEMLRAGFTVGQVVHEYGNLCQAMTELAIEWDASITVDEFHAFSGCLHDAIAHAVTEYMRLRLREELG